MGGGGAGRFVQTGGTNTIAGALRLGGSNLIGYTSDGTYELRGGELSAGSLHVGHHSTGRFLQSGGTATVSDTSSLGYSYGAVYVGSSGGSDGTYELSGGQLAAGSEYVGYEGTGQFIQTDNLFIG